VREWNVGKWNNLFFGLGNAVTGERIFNGIPHGSWKPV